MSKKNIPGDLKFFAGGLALGILLVAVGIWFSTQNPKITNPVAKVDVYWDASGGYCNVELVDGHKMMLRDERCGLLDPGENLTYESNHAAGGLSIALVIVGILTFAATVVIVINWKD